MNQALPSNNSLLWSAPAYLAGVMSAAGAAGFVLCAVRMARGLWAYSYMRQAFALLLWSAVLALAAGVLRRKGPPAWLWAAGMVAVCAACLAAYSGLCIRQILDASWPGLLHWATPVLLAMGSVAGALLVMRAAGLRCDSVLAGCLLLLTGLSVVLLGRIGAEITAAGRQDVLNSLALRQAGWIAAGSVAMLATAQWATPRRQARIARRKNLLPIAAAALLAATWFFGPMINGRRLWLVLGGLSVQTVELVKAMMVLFAAGYFAVELPQLNGRAGSRFISTGRSAGPLLLMMALPLAALVIMRDFGPTVLLLGFMLGIYFLATGQIRLPFAATGAVAGLGWLGLILGWPPVLEARFRALMEPFSSCEQLSRGIWSIAAGGVWGSGLGMGRPQTVPLAYSDFVFAAWCEETGLLGGLALLAVFALLSGWMLVSASRLRPLPRLAVGGIGLLLALQAVLVMGGVSGLIPLAGLTLPFVSYGGSSIVVNMALMGLALRMTGHAEQD